MLTWTFMEYVIHYWLGHLPKGKLLISAEHIKHHKDILYFSPISLKIRGALPLLSILWVGAYLLFGLSLSVGFVLSIAGGWTAYEYLHQAIHVRGPKNKYGRWAARNHLYHHFAKPNRNHGVTTPMWDIILRTHDPVEKVRIREKDAANIPWLSDRSSKNS